MTFSIVIPTKNRPKRLIAVFESILNQKKIPEQIIIIDQSDDDKVNKSIFFKLIKKFKLILHYIHDKKINGLVEAKHMSISLNTCNYVTFLDDDIILEKNYLYEIENSLKKSPDMIGLNGFIKNYPKVSLTKRLIFRITHFGIFRDNRMSIISSIKPDSINPKKVDVLSGGLSTWRRDVLDSVPFDIKNGFHAYEDKEFSMRVFKKFSKSFFIIPLAKLNHYHSEVNRQTKLNRVQNDVIEIIMFFKKNWKLSFLGLDLIVLLFGLLINSIMLSIKFRNHLFVKNFLVGTVKGFQKGLYK